MCFRKGKHPRKKQEKMQGKGIHSKVQEQQSSRTMKQGFELDTGFLWKKKGSSWQDTGRKMWAGREEQCWRGAEAGRRTRGQTSCLGGGFGRSLAKPPARARERNLAWALAGLKSTDCAQTLWVCVKAQTMKWEKGMTLQREWGDVLCCCGKMRTEIL